MPIMEVINWLSSQILPNIKVPEGITATPTTRWVSGSSGAEVEAKPVEGLKDTYYSAKSGDIGAATYATQPRGQAVALEKVAQALQGTLYLPPP